MSMEREGRVEGSGEKGSGYLGNKEEILDGLYVGPPIDSYYFPGLDLYGPAALGIIGPEFVPSGDS